MAEVNKYEMMVIVRPDLNQKQTEEELKHLRDFIKSQKGSIYHEDIRGMRRLAHRIKKHDSGYYAVFYFEIAPEEIKELSRSVCLEQNIIRYLIVKTHENYEIQPMESFELEEQSAPVPAPAKEEAPKPTVKSVTKPIAKKTSTKKSEAPEPKEDKIEVEEKTTAKEKQAKEKPVKKEDGSKLEEIDEKLQSIIDDPDSMKI